PCRLSGGLRVPARISVLREVGLVRPSDSSKYGPNRDGPHEIQRGASAVIKQSPSELSLDEPSRLSPSESMNRDRLASGELPDSPGPFPVPRRIERRDRVQPYSVISPRRINHMWSIWIGYGRHP